MNVLFLAFMCCSKHGEMNSMDASDDSDDKNKGSFPFLIKSNIFHSKLNPNFNDNLIQKEVILNNKSSKIEDDDDSNDENTKSVESSDKSKDSTAEKQVSTKKSDDSTTTATLPKSSKSKGKRRLDTIDKDTVASNKDETPNKKDLEQPKKKTKKKKSEAKKEEEPKKRKTPKVDTEPEEEPQEEENIKFEPNGNVPHIGYSGFVPVFIGLFSMAILAYAALSKPRYDIATMQNAASLIEGSEDPLVAGNEDNEVMDDKPLDSLKPLNPE